MLHVKRGEERVRASIRSSDEWEDVGWFPHLVNTLIRAIHLCFVFESPPSIFSRVVLVMGFSELFRAIFDFVDSRSF